MKKLILLIVFMCLILILQRDDNLSKETLELIGRIDSTEDSQSYLFLLGIHASSDDTPLSLGKILFEEYKKLEKNQSYKIAKYPKSKSLRLPTGEEFCRSWQQENCLQHLFSPELDIKKLLAENRLLLSRSDTFFNFDEFRTLSKPTKNEYFPPYQYLMAAERIRTLEAILAYRNGNSEKSIGLLEHQFQKLINAMELQDNLIGKVNFLLKASEIIDIISVILYENETIITTSLTLHKPDKSFYMIAAREFGVIFYQLIDMDVNTDYLNLGINFPNWTKAIMYKPNMTINSITKDYYHLEYLAQLSASEFAKQVKLLDKRTSTPKTLNYQGNKVASTKSSHDRYVAMFFDFEAKLELFNQTHILRLGLENMENPYYGKETPTKSNGNLCFRGPLPDKKSLRCLKLEL